MYLVRFSDSRVVEFGDAASFEQRVRRWLVLREAENSYLLSELPVLHAAARSGGDPNIRMFAIEEENTLAAVGAIFPGGCLRLTWATHPMVEMLAEHAANQRWNITCVCAPSHVAWDFAKAFGERTHQHFQIDRAERVYQLTSVTAAPAAHGSLQRAMPADKPLLRQWLAGFVEQTAYELGDQPLDGLLDSLVDQGQLYLWNAPQAVAMAACIAPTPNGACLSFVYVPAELRGRGHGKAVSAALASRMLAAGAGGFKYCFIYTDSDDRRTNHLYQSIGARTLCEFMRCSFQFWPSPVTVSHTAPARGLVAQ